MIFEHTDADGDKVKIEHDGGRKWCLETQANWSGRKTAVFLNRDAIRRLYEAVGKELGYPLVPGLPAYPSDHDHGRLVRPSPEPEPSWPDDGRRVAALTAAHGILVDADGWVDIEAVTQLADWIVKDPRCAGE